MSKLNVFLTGSTGLLGSILLKKILLSTCHQVHLLVRGDSKAEAENRVFSILKSLFPNGDFRKHVPRIFVYRGVLEKSKFGLAFHDYQTLVNTTNIIYHCAATTSFQISEKEGKEINLGGTRNVLILAKSCKHIITVNYIGTTFIAGKFTGVFSENDFNLKQKFHNFYESSKFEAEALVRSYCNSKTSTLIYRPSVIMGDYFKGETTNFEMFYNPIKLFSKKLFKEVPANRETYHNLIPVDLAAEQIMVLSSNVSGNFVFHVNSPNDTNCGYFMDLAARYFKYTHPRFVPIEKFNMRNLTPVQIKMIQAYLPYFNYKCKFSSYETGEILGQYGYYRYKIDTGFYLRAFTFLKKMKFIHS